MSDARSDYFTHQLLCSRCKTPVIGGVLYASGRYEPRSWKGLICGECRRLHDEECAREVLEQAQRDTEHIRKAERAGERIDDGTMEVL